jgi:hypothetical protein
MMGSRSTGLCLRRGRARRGGRGELESEEGVTNGGCVALAAQEYTGVVTFFHVGQVSWLRT